MPQFPQEPPEAQRVNSSGAEVPITRPYVKSKTDVIRRDIQFLIFDIDFSPAVRKTVLFADLNTFQTGGAGAAVKFYFFLGPVDGPGGTNALARTALGAIGRIMFHFIGKSQPGACGV